MNYRATSVLIISLLFLSGCSYLTKLTTNSANKEKSLAQPIQYNFMTPRRKALDQQMTAKITRSSNNNSGLQYYSASGHQCRTLSLKPIKSACLVDKQWLETAPILIVNIP